MTANTHADDARLKEIAAKIPALEAMTEESANATPGEVENATALIQKLLTKYNLSLESARKLANTDPKRQTETPIVIITTLNHGARRFEWEESLAHNIARGFFCKVLYFRLGYYFIGTHNDVITAIQTFNRLRPLIALMATRSTKAYADEWTAKGVMDTRQLRGEYSLKSYKLSYQNGVVAGIGRKLADQRREDENAAAGQVTALVVVRDAAIDAHIAQKWPKVSNGRASDSTHNAEAYEQGRIDGYNVNLHKGELSDGISDRSNAMDRIRELAQQIVNTFEKHDPTYEPDQDRLTYGHCEYRHASGYNFEQIHYASCPAALARRILLIVADRTDQ